VENVLAPKVYLAHAGGGAVKASGALVIGDGVDIRTTDNLVNRGGLIDGANGRTVLVAGQDIVNREAPIMDSNLTSISYSQARVIAEQHARANLAEFAGSSSQILKSEYLEAEHCWMFFRSEEIDVPAEATLGMRWAYVVSKKGTYSMVQDLSDDQQRLRTYLQTMSDYFQRRGE